MLSLSSSGLPQGELHLLGLLLERLGGGVGPRVGERISARRRAARLSPGLSSGAPASPSTAMANSSLPLVAPAIEASRNVDAPCRSPFMRSCSLTQPPTDSFASSTAIFVALHLPFEGGGGVGADPPIVSAAFASASSNDDGLAVGVLDLDRPTWTSAAHVPVVRLRQRLGRPSPRRGPWRRRCPAATPEGAPAPSAASIGRR